MVNLVIGRECFVGLSIYYYFMSWLVVFSGATVSRLHPTTRGVEVVAATVAVCPAVVAAGEEETAVAAAVAGAAGERSAQHSANCWTSTEKTQWHDTRVHFQNRTCHVRSLGLTKYF